MKTKKLLYALNLDEDGRILSATYETYAAAGMPAVETLPDGDIQTTNISIVNMSMIR